MPGKLINTLKYGNGKTKRKLYLLLGILVAGVVLTLVALLLGNVLLGLVAFVVIFVDGLILFNTSFEQKSVSVEKPVRKKREKQKKEKNEAEEEEPGALEWVSSEKKEKKSKELPEEEDTQNPLKNYDEAKLKKIMVAYKVKKHHVPVMIDRCQAEKIMQSPAYMWNDATYLYFLVLEQEPRMIKSKLSDSDRIHSFA